jgi:hypothetical protein
MGPSRNVAVSVANDVVPRQALRHDDGAARSERPWPRALATDASTTGSYAASSSLPAISNRSAVVRYCTAVKVGTSLAKRTNRWSRLSSVGSRSLREPNPFDERERDDDEARHSADMRYADPLDEPAADA